MGAKSTKFDSHASPGRQAAHAPTRKAQNGDTRLERAEADRASRPRRRNRRGGRRHRRTRQSGRRDLLQHGDDRLSGDPDRPLLCRADRHLHVSSYRQYWGQRGGYRDGQRRFGVGCAGCCAQNTNHRTRELARHATAGSVAEGTRDRRHRRDRHACPDRAHPRGWHAERHRRARAGWRSSTSRPCSAMRPHCRT